MQALGSEYLRSCLQIKLQKIISKLSDLQYFIILNVKLFIECRNVHSYLSQGQFILMGGFEHCTLYSGETTEENFQNILNKLLADKNDWKNELGTKKEFYEALGEDLKLAKLAIMQSFLRRKEQDKDEKEAGKNFYRWSSRKSLENDKDLSKDYVQGETICIDRYMY